MVLKLRTAMKGACIHEMVSKHDEDGSAVICPKVGGDKVHLKSHICFIFYRLFTSRRKLGLRLWGQ